LQVVVVVECGGVQRQPQLGHCDFMPASNASRSSGS
jgi:hypothetical protein